MMSQKYINGCGVRLRRGREFLAADPFISKLCSPLELGSEHNWRTSCRAADYGEPS